MSFRELKFLEYKRRNFILHSTRSKYFVLNEVLFASIERTLKYRLLRRISNVSHRDLRDMNIGK